MLGNCDAITDNMVVIAIMIGAPMKNNDAIFFHLPLHAKALSISFSYIMSFLYIF